MNEKEIFNLLGNVEDDLIDEKIDELLNHKGEKINISRIREKAMYKIDNSSNLKKLNVRKKIVLAVAIVASLTVTTVYGSEIYHKIQSFFNKSVVYSTVVDGTAYYLPEQINLNETFTLLNASVSSEYLDISIMANEELNDEYIESLEVSIVPMNDAQKAYSVGGYEYDNDNVIKFNFMNKTENNYNIEPFETFILTIGESKFNITLLEAEQLNSEDNLVIGNSEKLETTFVNIAGSISEENNKSNIQLVAEFDMPDLKLVAFGEPNFVEFKDEFENNADGVTSYSSGLNTKSIIAYDGNNEIILSKPDDAVGRPITFFETNTKFEENILVKIPTILVGFEKEVNKLNLSIPSEGKVLINKELDFIIQNIKVKSMERISSDMAIVEFELNTGSDASVSVIDIGAYSDDVISGSTVINGDVGIMTVKFDQNVDNLDFIFSYPSYKVEGDWSIYIDNKNLK